MRQCPDCFGLRMSYAKGVPKGEFAQSDHSWGENCELGHPKYQSRGGQTTEGV